MKLFEYFYMGKPIISSNILELQRFPDLIKIASNLNEWQRSIKYSLINKLPGSKTRQEKAFAVTNSWSSKIGKILQLIDRLQN
jgi:hypothetical protein